ncbi:hypothetical protein C8R46DRAFT_1058478, partial [Mycena filopes]
MAPRITPRFASRVSKCLLSFLLCSALNSFFTYPPYLPLAWVVPHVKVAFGAFSLAFAILLSGALIYYNVSPQDGEVVLEPNPDLPLEFPEPPPPPETTLPGAASMFLGIVIITAATDAYAAYLVHQGRLVKPRMTWSLVRRVLVYEVVGGGVVWFLVRCGKFWGRRRRERKEQIQDGWSTAAAGVDTPLQEKPTPPVPVETEGV